MANLLSMLVNASARLTPLILISPLSMFRLPSATVSPAEIVLIELTEITE